MNTITDYFFLFSLASERFHDKIPCDLLWANIQDSIGEGNSTPLQYSCLENLMDGGAWWAACSPWGLEKSDTTERLHFHFSLACIGEGNGNPLPCSCLENPRDGGAWWAAVYGVAQSRTRLKRLSSSNRILWCMLLCADLPPDLVWLQKFSFIIFAKLYTASFLLYMFNKWLLILYVKSWKGWLDGDKSRSSKS